jgi:hypothetical protein
MKQMCGYLQEEMEERRTGDGERVVKKGKGLG